MTATTAYCTPTSIFHQLQILAKKSPFGALSRQNPLSSTSGSIINNHYEDQQSKSSQASLNDERIQYPTSNMQVYANTVDILSDDEKSWNDEILACVGLRCKTKRQVIINKPLKPLSKRLAVPVCLLPLSSNYERVRTALYIVLPFLKFISIIHDYDNYCPSDSSKQAELFSLPFNSTNRRKLPKSNKLKKSQSLSKEDFIVLATNLVTKANSDLSTDDFVESALHCCVFLDRLDNDTIDQMIKVGVESNWETQNDTATKNRLIDNYFSSRPIDTNRSRKIQHQIGTQTSTITQLTMTTNTKQKSITRYRSPAMRPFNQVKRIKTSNENDPVTTNTKTYSIAYERIYMKCFICSKRDYIDAKVTNSDTLHLHWLQHDHNLSLNIYDSEIDSILTRVVEFFHFPRRHSLEGKVQTVFILNSEEVRKTRPVSISDDSCIVLD